MFSIFSFPYLVNELNIKVISILSRLITELSILVTCQNCAVHGSRVALLPCEGVGVGIGYFE